MRKIQILLIEDDADDVELLQEALAENGVEYDMTVLKEGNEALSYLREDKQLPDIVIMDFNLPKVHGREVIREIRANPKFANIPVLILSTSSSSTDINYAFEAGATSYLVKPATIEAINQTVSTIVELSSKSMAERL